jgi:hypothetical protein
MIIQWTNNIVDQEDKKRFEKTVISAKPVLERQLEIIDDMKRGLDSEEKGLDQFNSVSWPYRQAYLSGYRAALTDVSTLIDLNKQTLPDHKE